MTKTRLFIIRHGKTMFNTIINKKYRHLKKKRQIFGIMAWTVGVLDKQTESVL